MLSSSILDVAIGMAFIYLLLSLIATTVQEMIAAIAQTRAANLERGIRSLFSGGTVDGTLDGDTFVDRIYTHGLIRGLYRDPSLDFPPEDPNHKPLPPKADTNLLGPNEPGVPHNWHLGQAVRGLLGIVQSDVKGISDQFLLPAYIPSRTFAITLIHILSEKKDDTQLPLEAIEAKLRDLVAKGDGDKPEGTRKTAEALLALLAEAKTVHESEERFRRNIENWYNDAMDRVSGWYKKDTQNILMVIGLALAIIFNVDTIRVARTLWFDKDARQGLANAASTYIQTNPPAVADNAADASDATATDSSTASTASAASRPKAPAPVSSTAGAKVQATPPSCVGEDHAANATLCEKVLVDRMKTTVDALNEVSAKYLLPVGWRYSGPDYVFLFSHPSEWQLLHILEQLAGWIITAIALSLGAPFWFDLLNKFMIVRNTVKPQEKSKNESSKDG